MSAPVCNIIPPDTPGSPTAKTVPTIPVANDLQSALRALQAITQWINSQQNPPATTFSNKGGSGGGGGGGGQTKPQQPKPQVGRWNEVGRSTQTVKIFNPDDKSQFVEVLQLTSLTMQDSVTKETWVWHL